MADPLQQLGARIRGYRKATEMTQAMLAARAGLHSTYVSQIERGEARNVSVLALIEIGAVLRAPLKDLLDLQQASDPETEEGMSRVVEGMRRLTDPKRRAVLQIVGKVVEEVDRL